MLRSKILKYIIFVFATLLFFINIIYAYSSSIPSITEVKFKNTNETTYLYSKEHFFENPIDYSIGVFSPYITFHQINSNSKTILKKNVFLPVFDFTMYQNIYEPNLVYINPYFYCPLIDKSYEFDSAILSYNLDTSNFSFTNVNESNPTLELNPNSYIYGNSHLVILSDPYYYLTENYNKSIFNIDTNNEISPLSEYYMPNNSTIIEINNFVYYTSIKCKIIKYDKINKSFKIIEDYANTPMNNPLYNFIGDYNNTPIVYEFGNGILYKIDDDDSLIPFCSFNTVNPKTGETTVNEITDYLYLNKKELLTFINDSATNYHLYVVNLETGKKTEVISDYLVSNAYYYPAYTYNNNLYIEEINLNNNTKNVLIFDSNTFEYKDTIFVDNYNPEKEVPSQFLFLEYNQ